MTTSSGKESVCSASARHVCLVTPGHLATNPRLVKEADALVMAGYEVSVVASRFVSWADEADKEFATRPWTVHRVPFGPMAGRLRHLWQSARRRAALLVYRLIRGCGEVAFHPAIPALTRAACAVRADLYIAHNLAALPAAYRAALKHGAKLGFDAEDFHSGELNDTSESELILQLTRHVERRYLPACDHLTAASPGIAKAYAEAYGINEPVVVLNVFPKADAPTDPTSVGSARRSPSMYWFSQTVGPNRGLETVIEAIGMSRTKPHLYLRGNPAPNYKQELMALAEGRGLFHHITMLPPAPPKEMVRLTTEYDVGLATETSTTVNRNICLTNKIFTYLLAGLPVLASDTSAQSYIAKLCPEAIFTYPQQDPQALASAIDNLFASSEKMLRARSIAWQLGQRRFNWDIEREAFLRRVETSLG